MQLGATLYRTMYNLVTTYYKLVTTLLQPCYKLVTALLQPCTTRLQQACDRVVTSLTFPYGLSLSCSKICSVAELGLIVSPSYL